MLILTFKKSKFAKISLKIKREMMIIIGHKAIKCAPFVRIHNQFDIDKTRADEICIFSDKMGDSLALANFCLENEVAYGVEISSILNLILFSQLNAKYLILSPNLAHEAQKIANDYFFDSKILCVIERENEIGKVAKNGIDGVIFSHILK